MGWCPDLRGLEKIHSKPLVCSPGSLAVEQENRFEKGWKCVCCLRCESRNLFGLPMLISEGLRYDANSLTWLTYFACAA